MSKLHFDYYMLITYAEAVSICHFTIKCIPQDTERQKISNLKIELLPQPDYSEGKDSFGNAQIYGCVGEPHEMFSFRITGEAQLGPIYYEEVMDPEMAGHGTLIFRNPYGLNKPGDRLREYFHSIDLDENRKSYDKCILLMHRLYQDYTYEKNCTTLTTTAEEAWTIGKGVCQDYAHILIALLHMAHIPARYVTGMLIGEGASHAWVEAYCDGIWYGLDPTNDVCVTDSHIRIGTGRDASDCQINRGVMRGGGSQTQTIRVMVEEMPE